MCPSLPSRAKRATPAGRPAERATPSWMMPIYGRDPESGSLPYIGITF